MPQVSVLFPARDAAATLDRAVESILAQTLFDLELVAVDDGSTDDTLERLESWAGRDARVKPLRSPGRGLVQALQAGLEHCRAPLVARMDADDESLPTRLEASVAALAADPTLAAVGVGVEIFRDDQPVSPNMLAYARWMASLDTPELLFRDRLIESPLCHPATTIRRQALHAVGGWEDGEYAEDWSLWLELLSRGWRLKNLPQVLFRWRDRDQRLTRTDPRYAWGQLVKLRAKHLARQLDGECVVWGAGELGLALARALASFGVRVERFIEVNPRKIGQVIHGAPVTAPHALGAPAGPHLVAAVGAKGAREEIRAHLDARGWLEGRDYTCAG